MFDILASIMTEMINEFSKVVAIYSNWLPFYCIAFYISVQQMAFVSFNISLFH